MGNRKEKISMKIIEFDLQSLRYCIYLNNKDHNKNFPSFVHSNGHIFWCLNNKRHNPYGWTVKHSNGVIRYYLNDKQYTKEQWKKEKIKYL